MVRCLRWRVLRFVFSNLSKTCHLVHSCAYGVIAQLFDMLMSRVKLKVCLKSHGTQKHEICINWCCL